MPLPAFSCPCVLKLTLGAAVIAAGLPGMALATGTSARLDWQNKTAAESAPAYPVPPSPYGQVGDPFLHTLNWPAKPVAAPQPAAVLTPVPVRKPPPAAEQAYQVPATSKYAARIAAARAAQTRDQTQAQTPAEAPTATAPEPAAPLAAQETDHVFIPGEHYTDASEAPRLYSLHRQYGLKPDPITVDNDATGALLDTAPAAARTSGDDGAAAPADDDPADSPSRQP